jgi:hypothetical protein
MGERARTIRRLAVTRILGVSNFGNYAQMTIDPSDDCTFWFASSYYPSEKATRRTLRRTPLPDVFIGLTGSEIRD